MRVLVINNMASGLRNQTIYDFLRAMERDGDEVCLRSTNGTTRIEDALYDATSYDLVVASGGDSTISTVCYELHDTGVPILPFPAGTGNLIATNLHEPDEPFALANAARALKTEVYDMGEVRYMIDDHEEKSGFCVIAGAGYDASIMAGSEKLKNPFGQMAYVASAFKHALPPIAHFVVDVDDGTTIETDGIATLVVNFAEIFPDVAITPHNDARDGLFEVVILKQHNAFELIPDIFTTVLNHGRGTQQMSDAVEIHRSSHVRIEADPPLQIQFDGDALDTHTPFEAHVLPKSVRFVVA
jgi:diacylglycerol kinase family enzyme